MCFRSNDEAADLSFSYINDYSSELTGYLESICGLNSKEIQTLRSRVELFIRFVVRECKRESLTFSTEAVHSLVLKEDVEVSKCKHYIIRFYLYVWI